MTLPAMPAGRKKFGRRLILPVILLVVILAGLAAGL